MEETRKVAGLKNLIVKLYKKSKKMETIYQFLCEGILLVLLICIVVLVAWGIVIMRIHKVSFSEDSVGDEPQEENSEKKVEAKVFAENVTKIEKSVLLSPRCLYIKAALPSQTDVILREFPDLLPESNEQLEILRKEWKKLGGKIKMTFSEKVRYAAIGHILTVFEARRK